MTYDFWDRQITTDGEVDDFSKEYFDNLDCVIKSERYNTTSGGNLIGRSVTNFDARNRVYQTIVYAVDPSTGTNGNSLTDNFWFDAAGNQLKSFPAGSSLFTKTTYDSIGRQTIQYTAYGPDSTYADASSVTNNTVLEQLETTYDADSKAIQAMDRKRYHNAFTGEPEGPRPTTVDGVWKVWFGPQCLGELNLNAKAETRRVVRQMPGESESANGGGMCHPCLRTLVTLDSGPNSLRRSSALIGQGKTVSSSFWPDSSVLRAMKV